MNLNKVFLIGRLTADPQLRTTPSGHPVVRLGIATNRVWTDKSGSRQKDTEFHNVVVWGRQAEIASQFLVKGSLVCIEGRISTRAWQDKQGQERKTTDIICERFQMGPRPSGTPAARGAEAPAAAGEIAPEEEVPVVDIEEGKEEVKPEDLPF